MPSNDKLPTEKVRKAETPKVQHPNFNEEMDVIKVMELWWVHLLKAQIASSNPKTSKMAAKWLKLVGLGVFTNEE